MTDHDRKFQRLWNGYHFDDVVTANRAYLSVAVPEAPRWAGERWVLTCLPSTRSAEGDRRLSAVNMRWMETFVLYLPRDTDQIYGLVNLRQSVLEDAYGSLERARDAFGLAYLKEKHYRDVQHDGCQARGTVNELIDVLTHPTFTTAVRALANSLLTSRTAYARFHNRHLAAAVIGGVEDGRP